MPEDRAVDSIHAELMPGNRASDYIPTQPPDNVPDPLQFLRIRT